MLERAFWESWSTALSINQEGQYSIKKEHKDFIDNNSLMEQMHSFRKLTNSPGKSAKRSADFNVAGVLLSCAVQSSSPAMACT